MSSFARFFYPAAPATRLAMLRIIVGGFATGYVFARSPHLLSYAGFDPAGFRPVGIVALLAQPLSSWLVYAITIATMACSVAYTVGYRFRLAGPLFSLLLLWTLSYRNSWGMIFHTENLLVLHVIIVGLARSADAWSLDARSMRTTAGAEEEGRYGWPIRLMAIAVVVAYLLAGIAKFRWGGVGWMDGEVLRNLVATDAVKKILLGSFYSPIGAAMIEFELTFKMLAVLTIIFELGAPLALLGRRAATVWCVGAIAFHWGVQVLMMITFPYPMFGFAFACFFPVDDWWLRFRARSSRRR